MSTASFVSRGPACSTAQLDVPWRQSSARSASSFVAASTSTEPDVLLRQSSARSIGAADTSTTSLLAVCCVCWRDACSNLSLSVERHEREGQPLKRLLRILTPTEGGVSHARRGRGSAARRRRGTAVRWQRQGSAAAPPTAGHGGGWTRLPRARRLRAGQAAATVIGYLP